MLRSLYSIYKNSLIDKNLLLDGESIGKLNMCVKTKPQQDAGLCLVRHLRENCSNGTDPNNKGWIEVHGSGRSTYYVLRYIYADSETKAGR
jgi:hypothetical protein